MKKTNSEGFSVIEALLILVIIGILGGVGYYVYTQNKNTPAPQATQQKKESTDGLQSDWVEYKNQKYGFSFYHPKEYKLTFDDIYRKPNGSSIASVKVPGIDVTIVNEPDNSNDGVKNGLRFTAVRESDNIGNSYDELNNPGLQDIVKDLKKVNINSNSGFQYRRLGESDSKSYLYNDNFLATVFEKNSYVYTLTYNYPYDGNTDKYIEAYNGMLNSLVLTNPR